MTDDHVLRAIGVSQTWKDRDRSVTALKNVSAEFVPGRAHFLCGPSGSGKSTLGMVLAGLVPPTLGSVTLHNEDIRRWRDEVAFLFQFPEAIFFTESIEKEFSSVSPRTDAQQLEIVFQRIGVSWEEIRHFHPFTLSEGYARLAALAMQMVRAPSILILDEPTIGLDWRHQERVIENLTGWMAPDRVLITITHDLDLLSALQGWTHVLAKGEVAWNGATSELLSDDSLLRTSALRA